MASDASAYWDLAERSWRWVLDQVRWSDGPWIPLRVEDEGEPAIDPEFRDGIHEGVGSLALTLAEVRLTRPWTTEESELAQAIAERLTRQIPQSVDISFFDGLSGMVASLVALDVPGA